MYETKRSETCMRLKALEFVQDRKIWNLYETESSETCTKQKALKIVRDWKLWNLYKTEKSKTCTRDKALKLVLDRKLWNLCKTEISETCAIKFKPLHIFSLKFNLLFKVFEASVLFSRDTNPQLTLFWSSPCSLRLQKQNTETKLIQFSNSQLPWQKLLF